MIDWTAPLSTLTIIVFYTKTSVIAALSRRDQRFRPALARRRRGVPMSAHSTDGHRNYENKQQPSEAFLAYRETEGDKKLDQA